MKKLLLTIAAILFSAPAYAQAAGCDAYNSNGLVHNQWIYSNPTDPRISYYTRRAHRYDPQMRHELCQFFTVTVSCNGGEPLIIFASDNALASPRDARAEFKVDNRRPNAGLVIQWGAGPNFDYVAARSHASEIVREWSRGKNLEVKVFSSTFGRTEAVIDLANFRSAFARLGNCRR